jgi:hypothetical protein
MCRAVADVAGPWLDLAAGASDLCAKALAAAPLLIHLLASSNPVRRRARPPPTRTQTDGACTHRTRADAYGHWCVGQVFEEQAAFTLGNMAADSAGCRDTIVANGALMPLARLLDTQIQVVPPPGVT